MIARALCALLLASSLALPARAETAQAEPLAPRLAPTPEALHAQRTRKLEQDLARVLSALPAVARAEVQLTLPASYAEPLDAPLPPARATVVVSGAASRDDVLHVLRAAVPTLRPTDLTLLERTNEAPRDATSFVQVGPFRVHPSSARGLRVWLTVSLAANALLAAFVLLRVRRR